MERREEIDWKKGLSYVIVIGIRMREKLSVGGIKYELIFGILGRNWSLLEINELIGEVFIFFMWK